MCLLLFHAENSPVYVELEEKEGESTRGASGSTLKVGDLQGTVTMQMPTGFEVRKKKRKKGRKTFFSFRKIDATPLLVCWC